MINFEKLHKARDRYRELEGLLGDPQVIADQPQYQKFAKEFSSLGPVMDALKAYDALGQQIADSKKLLEENHDKEFEALILSEIDDLKVSQKEAEVRLDELANPKPVDKDTGVIIEIRAGTGGQEASLFAADLYRMYSRYAERQGWTAEIMSSNESEAGGFKEVVLSVSGKGAARHLKWESGVHRVQRVPAPEASGRIHTSAATVAVLEEPEDDVEIKIDPKDLKIDVYRSSGPGGQSVNTTDSAVRFTHFPTGIVVVCQDERSQLKNRAKAMRVLRARIKDKMQQEHFEKTSKERKSQIGTGDRSEKIRTYNFSDHRITDHRIGFTTHQLTAVLDGDMEDLMNALMLEEDKMLAEQSSEGQGS
ncbi:MAG: peptide chain release factor 1 [Candidatus Omnitrophica bacterium]|nr:peptide chain release factor 1 [Candidatus Omnitrophota bacterium]